MDDMPWPMKYFRIPASMFDATAVSADQVQSFYVTLRDVGALLYAPKEDYEDFLDPQRMQVGHDAKSSLRLTSKLSHPSPLRLSPVLRLEHV